MTGSTYLNETTINDTIKKIVRTDPTVSYINSYFMAYMIHTQHRNTGTVQSGLRKLRNHCEITYWILPHCHQQHWYYLTIDTKHQAIGQSDSLNTRARHYGEYLLNDITEIYGGV